MKKIDLDTGWTVRAAAVDPAAFAALPVLRSANALSAPARSR